MKSLALLAVLATAPHLFADVDAGDLRRRQESQQRARMMARELVTGILDVQLQQLEENGLKDLPVYREIAGMKQNINALIDREMEQVVELLIAARSGPADDRERAAQQARAMIREIVMRLSLERQNLLRRLKTAELTAQVRRLIQLESRLAQQTALLPEQPAEVREKNALAVIEDQRDAKQLFLQLVGTLSEVSRWGGPAGTGASDGLRLLAAAEVAAEFDRAAQWLESIRYREAAQSQQLVVKGLRLLLEKLEETQGLLHADRAAARELIRSLIDRQEQLRQRTRSADLNVPDAEKLVEEQASIRKELNRLGPALQSTPAADELLEQARAAAYEATGQLFDAHREQALAEQGKVLGNLAQIAEQLMSADELENPDKSADEYAQIVARLDRAREAIDRIRATQRQATRAARNDPAAAASLEQQAAAELDRFADKASLPNSIQSRLADAGAAAAQAAAELHQSQALDARQERAVRQADRAVERAAAEIHAALDDARRRAEAVKIGELARAAETLERAAAAEREIAASARRAAQGPGIESAAAKKLRGEQEEVGAIARRMTEAVKNTAPQAAEPLAEAIRTARIAEEQIARAGERPGAASKSPMHDAATAAKTAADHLSKAASDMRDAAGKAADRLATESARQLEKVSPARASVDKALSETDRALDEQISRLNEAAGRVREAQAEQMRASGRPDAADALQIAGQIENLNRQQGEADDAARKLAEGRSTSPLDAVTRQQAVAERATRLAEEAAKRPAAQRARSQAQADPVADALRRAAGAAIAAAKSELDGNKSQSAAARAQVRSELQRAQAAAASEARAAATAKAGRPDDEAQRRVTSAARDAAGLADAGAAQAAETLQRAQQASADAANHSESGNDEQAPVARRQAASSLQQAAEQIQQSLDQAAAEQGRQLAARAAQMEQLAEQSAAVDPAALGALREAQDRLAQTVDAMTSDAAARQQAQDHAQHDAERAAANLNAREQRVLRDRSIAEAMRELAREQQAAADEIAAQRDSLTKMSDQPAGNTGNAGGEKTAEAGRQEAARKLTEAQQKFAQSQRATGQGAEEISGQSEVANPPLREAMELASRLRGEESPAAELPGGQPGSEGAPEPGAPGKTPAVDQSPSAAQPESDGERNAAHGRNSAESSLGTGFVPNSPELTAEMIAGREALAQAAAALGRQQPGLPGQPQRDANGDPAAGDADAQAPADDAASPQQSKSAASRPSGKAKSADARQNGTSPDDAIGSDPAGEKRADAGAAGAGQQNMEPARAVREEAWFAKLPPELRQAIRARPVRRAPRGYEERLQRYFESIP
jgi:hypothetical protein